MKLENFYEILKKINFDKYNCKNNNINDLYLYKEIKNYIASKACRYSIMIGQNLNINNMHKIVNNLSKL